GMSAHSTLACPVPPTAFASQFAPRTGPCSMRPGKDLAAWVSPICQGRSAMKNRLRDAFTLIELLVVIAIISLLISILLPSLSAARERSRSVICLTQLRELSRSAFMYTNDNAVYPPCVDNYTASGWNSNKFG